MMKPKLRLKRELLLIKQKKSQSSLRKKLSSISGLIVEDFDDNSELLLPGHLWRIFSAYVRSPQHRIAHEIFEESGRATLKSTLDFLGHPKAMYLSVGGHGAYFAHVEQSFRSHAEQVRRSMASSGVRSEATLVLS